MNWWHFIFISLNCNLAKTCLKISNISGSGNLWTRNAGVQGPALPCTASETISRSVFSFGIVLLSKALCQI